MCLVCQCFKLSSETELNQTELAGPLSSSVQFRRDTWVPTENYPSVGRSVSLFVCRVYCGKTADSIWIPFEWWVGSV